MAKNEQPDKEELKEFKENIDKAKTEKPIENLLKKDLLTIDEINNKWDALFGKNVKTPVVLPVIHVRSPSDKKDLKNIWKNEIGQTIEFNINLVQKFKFHGIFLINHGFSSTTLVDICKITRKKYKKLFIGVNFLGCPMANPIEFLNKSGLLKVVNALWVDNSYISTNMNGIPFERSNMATTIAKTIKKYKWKGLYFGGVDFKYQGQIKKGDDIEQYKNKIKKVGQFASQGYMDVVCTSGRGTGKAADVDKMKAFRDGCQCKLAVASGVTAENVGHYKDQVDAILVATGISETFHKFSEVKMQKLASVLGIK